MTASTAANRDSTTAEASDRFVKVDWQIARTYSLSPQAGWLYTVLRSYADWETGEAFARKSTLAERLQYKQGRTLDKYLAELCSAGLLTIRKRFRDPHNWGDVVLDKADATHTEQTSNLYRVNLRPSRVALAQEVDDRTSPSEVMPKERTRGVRSNAHELEPSLPSLSKTSEKISADTVARFVADVEKSEETKHRAGEATPSPRPLHPQWEPNNANRAVALEYGVDVDHAAEVFVEAMNSGTPKRRRCWGAAFSRFIREVADVRTSAFGISEETLVGKAVDAAIASIRAAQGAAHATNESATGLTAAGAASKVEAAADRPKLQRRSAGTATGPATLNRGVEARTRHLDTIMSVLNTAGIVGASVRARAGQLLDSGTPFYKVADALRTELPDPDRPALSA